jgi:predicted Zn-dependent protease
VYWVAWIAGLQLILLTHCDPIGFESMIFDYLSGKVALYLTASHSRHNEEMADELGIEITAMACFDTSKGINIFKKFGELHDHTETEENHSSAAWTSSHPSSLDRYVSLKARSKEFASSYKKCQAAKTSWQTWLGGASTPSIAMPLPPSGVSQLSARPST